MSLLSSLKQLIRSQLALTEDTCNEQEIIDSIKQNMSLKGTTLWVLIFAICIASIGLNTNSAAVITGAMLISPLMGPIMAIGIGAAIHDLSLIKESVKTLFFAVLAALFASTLYFLVSPLNEAHSELLARTVPTIYDVFIAFFGGLTGMIAITRHVKSSNVIAGVSIATALMPPLCTAGFALANLNFRYFFGAFYMFLINCIYICLATYIVANFLKFKKVSHNEGRVGQIIRRSLTIMGLLALLPSVYIAYNLVGKEIQQRNIDAFVENEIEATGLVVLKKRLEEKNGVNNLFIIVLKNKNKELQPFLQNKLKSYNLNNFNLVLENSSEEQLLPNLAEIKSGVLEEIVRNNERTIELRDQEILALKEKIKDQSQVYAMREELLAELKILNPHITNINVTTALIASAEGQLRELLGYVMTSEDLKREERERIEEWLKVRTKTSTSHVLFKGRVSEKVVSDNKSIRPKNKKSAR